MEKLKRFFKGESGQALALVALAAVVLLGFAALAIDVGLMANSRSRLQHAADAAALAGAMDLPAKPSDGTTKAIQTAEAYVDKNVGLSVTSVVQPDLTAKTVRVTLSEPVKHFFAQFIGQNSTVINATAVAQKTVVWDGSALPLINLNQPLTLNSTFQLWDKGLPSDFEIIHDEKEGFKNVPVEEIKINYSDGLIVPKGFQAYYWDSYFEPLLGYPGPYYVFSISQSVYDNLKTGGGIKVKFGGSTELRYSEKGVYDAQDKFKNEDTIMPDQIVLVELNNVVRVGTGIGNSTINGTVTKVYDINNGEYPKNPTIGKAKSKLIE